MYNIESDQIKLFAGNAYAQGFKNGLKENAMFFYIQHCTFSPDGKHLIVCEYNVSFIRSINIITGEVIILHDLDGKICEKFCFGKDGKYMLMKCLEYVYSLNTISGKETMITKV